MTDITCQEFVELVTAYLDGALDEETEARVTAHLAQCDDCGRYLAQFRATVDGLGGLPAPAELPATARNALLAAFREKNL